MPPITARAQAWGTLALLALVWGSSYLLIKKSLLGLDAWQVGGLRITLASLAFVPAAWRLCRGLDARTWGKLFAVGLFGTGLPSLLFPLAQRTLTSSLAAMLSSLTPLMTTVVAAGAFGLVVSGRRALGIAIGLLGAFLLISARFGLPGGSAEPWPLASIGLAVAATGCYALSSNIVKGYLPDMPPLQVTAGAMAPLGLVAAVGLVAGGGLPLGVEASPATSVGELLGAYAAVTFLALIGTALASWLFFRLIQLTDPVFASTVSYLVPGVALGWGLADGEPVTLGVLGALAVILSGVYLTRR